MTDEDEIKIQNIRKKRTLATLELQELLKDRSKAEQAVQSFNKRIKEKVLSIRNYSHSIGQIKEGQGRGKVSDHAIVRYMERYKGVDIEAIINEILEHPDAKLSTNSGMVSTIFKEDSVNLVEAKKMIKLAKLRKAI